ncbi:MAG TPA: O-antigen ligase family protein [Bryobacteraceae bacterium]|nr:O-antigen ligase family protein [Bryobacteraceae bacterium]
MTQRNVDLSNPARRYTFYLVLVFVFLRVSDIHELLSVTVGFNSYLLLLVGVPAVVGVILTGAIRRTMLSRASRYWLAFFVWMVLAIPFSVWKSGSFSLVQTYARTELCLLFMLAGTPLLWSECRSVLYAFGLGSFVCVLIGRFFTVKDYGGERVSLAFGSIANSNDFAAHLLFALPFLLFVVLSPKTSRIVRIVSGITLLYGLFLTLDTASRGALVALGAVALYVLWRGSMSVRISMLVGLPLLALVAVAVLPGTVITRLQTFTTSSSDAASVEAAESARIRRYEFETSLRYTLEHPFFGVGPGEFSTYEGQTEKTIGAHGTWLQTHNVLTQISSECGIPAFLFFLGAIGSTFLLILRIQKQARLHGLREISMAAFCLGMSMVGFFTAVLFLNLAYRYYFPALTGLAITLYASVEQEIKASKPNHSVTPAPTPAERVLGTAATPSLKYRFGRLR